MDRSDPRAAAIWETHTQKVIKEMNKRLRRPVVNPIVQNTTLEKRSPSDFSHFKMTAEACLTLASSAFNALLIGERCASTQPIIVEDLLKIRCAPQEYVHGPGFKTKKNKWPGPMLSTATHQHGYYNGLYTSLNLTQKCPFGVYCKGGLATNESSLPVNFESVVTPCLRGMVCH